MSSPIDNDRDLHRVIFHLRSGKEIEAYWEEEGDASDEQIERWIFARIKGEPKWLLMGSALIFTGEVSAVEIDH